jgi:OOP family OmpA-OmpF porin
MSHRNIVKISIVLSGTVLLAGCSGWSATPPIHGQPIGAIWTYPAIQQAAPEGGGNFAHAVAHEYSDYATFLEHLAPPVSVDVDYFARKGLKAARGEVVPPEENANWAIPLEQPFGFRTQMAQGRQRLVTALDGGGRDRFPALAARAQARYDCWLERTEKDWTTGFDGTCHKEFLGALDELERNLRGTAVVAPAAAPITAQAGPARQYNVYFDFDKSALTPLGRQIVDQAADTMRREKSSRIVLVGKADLAGTDPYNLALSHRRADTVRGVLIADGVPADQIDERWVGEREPPVPTAPGVREPRNRVVEITLN